MNARRRPLSRERVVQAAFALVDREGVDALSMRRLASDLNVQAMSLYNHVENKDQILDELVELVVGEMEVPNPHDEWKTAMRQRAASAHEVLLRHPWAITPLLTRTNAGPVMLRYVDATLGCLVEAGFSYELADHIWNAMDNHIYGFTLQKASFPFRESEYADTAREFLAGIDTEKYPYFTELTTLVMERRHSGVHDLQFRINLILNGLERYLNRNEPE